MWNPNTAVSEDCLYLNLWVPAKFREQKNSSNATVMIWIYGGGFTSGTSTLDLYDGLTLAATNDVIVASMNYRVGAFGFLYFGTEEAPGNMGLYDQTMAIQWIKDNIQFFGGNPNSMTLFGESVGAASVSSHLLSPASRRLVKRFILQSGTLLSPWSHMTDDKAKDSALTLARNLGCNNTTDKGKSNSMVDNEFHSVIQCMKNVDARNLSLNQSNMYSIVVKYPFVPTVSL